MEGAIKQLLERLEAVTKRLESVEGQLGGAGAGAGAAAAGGAPAESGAAYVADYDALVSEHLEPLYKAVEKIGNDQLKEQTGALKNLVDAQRAFLNIASQCKKPSDDVLGKLLKETSDAVTKVISIRDSNRGNEQWNHLSTLSEGIPAFGWVSVSPTPGPYVKEYKGNAEFYSNKLRMQYKGKDEDQLTFAKSFSAFLAGLISYIKKYHTTAVAWKANGEDAAKFVGKAAPKAAAGGPPAPPPAAPPAAPKPTISKGPDMNALFGELSKGTAVTKGLKKVTKDMKTKYRKPEEKSSIVKAAPKKAAKKYGAAAFKGTPKFALEGNKWVIEFQVDNKEIVIEETETKHTVYIYKCFNSVIQIKGAKVNSICLDSCKKCAIVFNNAIASCELVNSNSCEVQCQGKVPSFAIDKCSGVQVYLSKDCLNTEFVSSKSDEMNVIIPGGDDIIELAVPEQFKTVIRDNKLVTNCVEHV